MRIFVPDGNAPSGEATGHTGVCEPVTSDDFECQNNWLSECAAADVEGDVTSAALSVTAAHLTLFTSLIAVYM